MTHGQNLLEQNGDRRPLELAILAAILVHLLVLYLTLPQPARTLPTERPVTVPIYRVPLPLPPPPEPPEKVSRSELKPKKKLIPIPDLTPDAPEPVREPEPDFVPEALPQDLLAFPGISGPPPVVHQGPRLPGIRGVSEPVRIHYVEPQFPPLARKAGIRARVRLQAIITEVGTVSGITVLYSSTPGLGFEDAALDAVRLWKYSPAVQDGKPVNVYLAIVIDFALH